jgi:hypothetical protein
MTHTTHLTRSAGIAIAAALAIGSTPSLAQMAPEPMPAPAEPVLAFPQSPPPAAEPVLVIPQTPPPAEQPAPTVVLPTELPDEAAVAEAEPAPVRGAAAPPSPQRATTPAATPAVTPAEPAAEAAPLVAEEPVLPSVIESEPIVPFTAAVAPVGETFVEPASGPTTALLVIVGALMAIGLAIWGFVAIGRRRTVDRKAAAISRRSAVTPPAPHPEPIAAETIPAAPPVAPTRIDRPTPAPSMAHSGASVPLPRTMPATFEEREALIRRMVAAKPDRANPFTAPLQRRRRARLILQSLGRDFGEARPWIDLGQYPANWPEMAGRKHAAA